MWKPGMLPISLFSFQQPIRKYCQLFLLIVDINGMEEVDRKLVKQTVMTSMYSVTYVGVREQIKRRLKGQSVIADHADLWGASCYAAKVRDNTIPFFNPCFLFNSCSYVV